MIKPIHPLERGEFHSVEMAPRSLPTNHFRLEETDHGFGEQDLGRTADLLRD
jgi:hypothetical protein